ncbi:DNA/RNA non-specific endonuclease [Treponema brennaborense]|uniref:Endonuclease n=1 Tax=Treponema brennaborense (strain DSM 12168 / CIP 105900 / DD5/3) TaxID=906968 RepID=F4LKF8_TREBD|nr:DNA/RNA non-specific endonuclease [Treponema brennaborense]AEE16532.1 DNA/RNA non-specific endonuclease [Treponema brennaborense DSM 12168]
MAKRKNAKHTTKTAAARFFKILLICTVAAAALIGLRQQSPTAQSAPATQSTPATQSAPAETMRPLFLSADLALPVCARTADSHETHSYEGFTLCYREAYEQAEWVAYEINRAELVKEAARSDNFRADPAITTGSATPADYKGSGYDRGHLAPAADMAFSAQAMSESFLMSNMSPQKPGFNRGVWKELESAVREWVQEFGSVYVVSGPVLEKATYPTIGANRVAVPEWYYKVLFVPVGPDGAPRMAAFLLPNETSDRGYEAFAVSVDEVEERTGLDFFAALDDALETSLEATVGGLRH